jgi:dihydrofolate synthase / folylpolyglutamate synthase
MGGRLDATNVVRPIAALVTPVGLDHTEFLGHTLPRVAAEKAGVIHRGAVVLTSNTDPIVLEVLRRRAATFGSRLIAVDSEHDTPLRGAFQRRNVALAVRAAEKLRPVLPRITPASIERGVASTRWRGRLELLQREGKEIWVDGLHNAHAAAAVAPFIEQNVGRPRLLVFGIMRDKDVGEVARILFPHFDRIIATEPYPPRSASAEAIAALGRRMGIDTRVIRQPRRALVTAMRSSERFVFIAGSLYLAGAAIETFDAQQKKSEHQHQRRHDPRRQNR